ncbi:MAG: hypothetical protein U0270_16675 [Labilithrix sp.]
MAIHLPPDADETLDEARPAEDALEVLPGRRGRSRMQIVVPNPVDVLSVDVETERAQSAEAAVWPSRESTAAPPGKNPRAYLGT